MAADRVDVVGYLDALIASHKALSADAYHVQELPKAEAVRAAVAGLVEAATRALPFLQDEADKYEDDGSNEPLETLRDLRAALASAQGGAA